MKHTPECEQTNTEKCKKFGPLVREFAFFHFSKNHHLPVNFIQSIIKQRLNNLKTKRKV